MIEIKYDIHQITVQGPNSIILFVCCSLFEMWATGDCYKQISNESFRHFAELSFTLANKFLWHFRQVERKQTFLLICTLSRYSQVFAAETEGRRRAPGSLLAPCISWITHESPVKLLWIMFTDPLSCEMTFDFEILWNHPFKRDIKHMI